MLLTAAVCALVAGASLHAQWSPDRDWTILQAVAAGRYAPRVMVRTATGQATGKLRAVEPNRLIFGDRANKPTIVARNEICEVFTSRHLVRPRTTVISLAIGGAVIAAAIMLPVKGAAARVFGALGLGIVLGTNMTRPARLLYSNPEACSL